MHGESSDAARLRRLTGWALVGGLCVAGAAAILALLSGSFDDTDGRVVLTSLGFSVFSATGAAGASLRIAARSTARTLGSAAVGCSAAAFGLLLTALWAVADWDADGIWRAFGIAALAALWASHASLVVRALRATDTPAVRAMSTASIAALGVDTSVGVLALLDVLRDAPSELFTRGLAALLVLTLLSTVLPPLLRRLGRRAPVAAPAVVDELAASLERLSAMDLPLAAHVELTRLRELARSARG